MTARIIDDEPVPETEDESVASFEELEALEAQTSEPEEPAPEETATATTEEESGTNSLPDKYRGKTAAEIAQMHMEAEKALGKQSNEVGELRKTFDDYILNQMKSGVAEEAPKEEPADFILEPEKAVAQQIENHPKIKQAEEFALQMARQTVESRLATNFPDWQATVQNPDFVAWIKESPVRQQLAIRADKFDYDSMAELLNNYKDKQMLTQRHMEVEEKAQQQALKDASTGTVRGNSDSKRAKKKYRRADIIRLMREDPSRYEQLEPEIRKAYQEGRVV